MEPLLSPAQLLLHAQDFSSAALRSRDERQGSGNTKHAWFIFFMTGLCLKGNQHYQFQHRQVR